MRFRSSCWTTNWSVNELTWQASVKCLLDEKALDQVRVGTVVDADANQQREPRLRHLVVPE